MAHPVEIFGGSARLSDPCAYLVPTPLAKECRTDPSSVAKKNGELASAANVTTFTTGRLPGAWRTNGAFLKRRGKVVLRSPERLFLHTI